MRLPVQGLTFPVPRGAAIDSDVANAEPEPNRGGQRLWLLGGGLVVIAAVILGGTALSGGRGSVIGTALGVLVLGVMANGMNLLGIDAFWQLFLSGVILLLAVVIDEQRNRARAR